MIGKLTGILDTKKSPLLIIDVNGVGYEVSASMSTIYKLGDIGSKVSLLIHMVVREDAQLLYGFYDEDERRLFREILKVKGVGAKLALTILSGMEAQDFVTTVLQGDVSRLQKLPGVGKKTAERLLVEMKDRLEKTIKQEPFSQVLLVNNNSTDAIKNIGTHHDDAISVLIALGYKSQDAIRVVHEVEFDGADSETIIKLALQSLCRS